MMNKYCACENPKGKHLFVLLMCSQSDFNILYKEMIRHHHVYVCMLTQDPMSAPESFLFSNRIYGNICADDDKAK